MLYNNCRELPIHNFFEISRTNDLKYLVKSGEPSEENILQDRYLEIIDEYNSLFSSKKNHGNINQIKMYILALKLMNLEVIELLIKDSGITDEIKEIAKRLRIRPDRISDYITGLKNDIKKLEKEISEAEKATVGEDKNHGDSLEKTLTLVKENGFNFDRFTTPIIEFVFAINRMEEKAKHHEKSKR